jgi:hypothetical protein
VIDAQTGAVTRTYPASVSAPDVVSDGLGGWFISGAGSVVGRPLARLRADGSLDQDWRPALPLGADPSKLIASGGRLYAAFPVGQSAFRIATVDAGTGRLLWTSRTFIRSPAAEVVLAASPKTLYVAGAVDLRGPVRDMANVDVESDSVLALSARDGHLLGWRGPQLLPGGEIEALVVSGSRLYVGGDFSWIDARERPALAAVSLRDGRLEPWAPETAEPPRLLGGLQDVRAIAVVGRAVVVGGRSDFAAYDTVTGRAKAWTQTLTPAADVFGVLGSTVFVGAGFPGFGSLITQGISRFKGRNNLAAIDVGGGRFTSWTPNVASFVSVTSMAISGKDVLVAGEFRATR